MKEPNWDEFNSAFEMARALWAHVTSESGAAFPPHRFCELIARIDDDCQDVPTLWQLGGALNDYLRRFPDAIAVPLDLPTRLLKSDDLEARVVGLKLLNRSNASDELVVNEIIRAIERCDSYETYGGFFELGILLEQRRSNQHPLASRLVKRLQESLSNFVDHADEYQRLTAVRLQESLSSLR